MDRQYILSVFEIYSETILLTKKIKAFIKLENLLEEQKTDFQIDFFTFNEEINQKIEIFMLETKKKGTKSSPLSPLIKVSLKKASETTSNKESKDFTITPNKLSKDYTPISLQIQDNSDALFTNTGSLTFDERAKMGFSTNFQAFSDKKSSLNNHPLGFIKYDNFFMLHPKSGEEVTRNTFFLIDSKKQESNNDFFAQRRSFEDR